jgi:hypothetical protein
VEMLNRRLRAFVAAGVIALSGGATATSVASEVDSQDEGVSTQPGTTDDAVDGGTGPETQLPVEVDPVLGDPDQDVTEAPGGVDPPATIPLEVAAPEANGSGGESDAESVPAPAEPPVGSPRPPTPLAPGPGGDAGGGSATALLVEDQGDIPNPPHLYADKGNQEPPPTSAVDAPPPGDGTVQTRPAAEPAPAPEAQPPESPAAGAPFHIVQAGESLWSIAAAVLGPRASTAAVTRQVHRLWKLNKGRIGTGDPNVLPTGVKLRLR